MRSSVDVSVLEGRTEVPRASGDFASRPSRTGLYVSGGHLPTAEGPSATGSAATAGPEARTCSGMATLASLAAAQAPLPPQPRLSIPELGRPQEVIPTTNNDFLSNWEALAAITAAPPPMLQPPSPLMPSPPPLSPLWDFGFMPPPVGRLSPAEFVLDFNDAWEINLGRALPPPLTRAFDSVFLRTSALARKEIDALPSFVFSEPQASSPHSIASPASCFPACVIPETSCAVCQCDYEPGETLRSLSCGGGKARHAFHRDCIDQWLVLHATCPVCRARVVSTAPAATADGATVAAGAGGAVAAAGGGGAAAAAGGSGEAAAAGAAAPPPPVVLSSQGPTIVAELTSRTGRVRRHASGSGPVLLRAGSPSASPAGLLEHGPRGWNTWADADGTMPQPTGFVTRLVFVIDSPQYPVRTALYSLPPPVRVGLPTPPFTLTGD